MTWSCWPRSETPPKKSGDKSTKSTKSKSRVGGAVAAATRIPRKVVGKTVSLVTAPFRGRPKHGTAAAGPCRQPDPRGTHFDRY